VIIGDVTGKGVQAATLTSLARHCTRFECRIDPRPSAVLRAINDALVAYGKLSLCSALCLRLRDDEIVVSAGGHPLPLVVGAGGGLREPGRPGLLLGIPEASGWYDEPITLAAGEMLLAYTDGATDARGAGGRYGEGGCVRCCARAPARRRTSCSPRWTPSCRRSGSVRRPTTPPRWRSRAAQRRRYGSARRRRPDSGPRFRVDGPRVAGRRLAVEPAHIDPA